jgi:hypothetical protein
VVYVVTRRCPLHAGVEHEAGNQVNDDDHIATALMSRHLWIWTIPFRPKNNSRYSGVHSRYTGVHSERTRKYLTLWSVCCLVTTLIEYPGSERRLPISIQDREQESFLQPLIVNKTQENSSVRWVCLLRTATPFSKGYSRFKFYIDELT